MTRAGVREKMSDRLICVSVMMSADLKQWIENQAVVSFRNISSEARMILEQERMRRESEEKEFFDAARVADEIPLP